MLAYGSGFGLRDGILAYAHDPGEDERTHHLVDGTIVRACTFDVEAEPHELLRQVDGLATALIVSATGATRPTSVKAMARDLVDVRSAHTAGAEQRPAVVSRDLKHDPPPAVEARHVDLQASGQARPGLVLRRACAHRSTGTPSRSKPSRARE